MATQIPERPGSFREFVEAATDNGVDVSVTEFKYRYSAGQVRLGGGSASAAGVPKACLHAWHAPSQ